MSEFLSILEDRVIPVVARNASSVDAEARFPSQSIEALRESGLLGLISRIEVGGRAGSVKDAASIIERLARECASTAMVTAMHYAATAVLEAHGSEAIRKDVAAGRHFTTLAFSSRVRGACSGRRPVRPGPRALTSFSMRRRAG
ncbi:MAG: acyl-CoA dehydrogenase family protein [Candidatus Eisenbacteria bacterium]